MNSPPRQNVFPQWFPSRMLFQNYIDPLSHNYFVGGSTCQASTTSVLHPPFHSNSTFKTCFEIWGMPSENAPSTCIRNLRITEGYPDTPIKKSSDKRECVALRSLPKQNWRKSQSTLSGNPAQCWLCKGVLLLFRYVLLFFKIDALQIRKRK